MESAHQLSIEPDCNNTAEVPSFTLRTALSAIPFVSDPCGVDVQWLQERSSQALPNSKELSVYLTFGFLSGSKIFCKLLWVSWENFCFARIRLDPLGGQVLHHDCIPVIVSRFAIVTEDLVICCHQVTKIFCTRVSCNFGPLTDLAISVFREMRKKHCAYPNPHVSWMWALKILREKNWRVSLCIQELHLYKTDHLHVDVQWHLMGI